MSKLNGVDVSGWQPANVLDLIPFDFAIIKISQGNSKSNSYADAQLKSARSKGLYGVYHFDNGNSDYKREVDAFLSEAVKKDIPGKGILFWDWEADAINRGIGRLAEIRKYLKTKLGYAAIYTSGSPARSYASEFKNWDYVWVASYGSNPQVSQYNPNATQSYWPDAVIHQYGSRGRLGRYNGDLDINVCHLTKDGWLAVAKTSKINGSKPQGTLKAADVVADEVLAGKWGNGADRKARLIQAGYDYDAIQAAVNKKLGPAAPPPVAPSPPAPNAKKTVDELAAEVLDGKWGNGAEREKKLTQAGHDYEAVQAVVNQRLGISPWKKTPEALAAEVLEGKWGNGADRERKLKQAGYDYDAVQAAVNKKLGIK